MLSVTGKGYSKIQNSENPFYEEPLPRAHYHPTPQKQLGEAERQLALSPQRPHGNVQQSVEERAETKFLSGSHSIKPLDAVQRYQPKSPNSSNFDESWPDSERPSSPSLTGVEDSSRLEPLPYASVRKHVQPAFTSSPKDQSRQYSVPYMPQGSALTSAHGDQHLPASSLPSAGGALMHGVGEVKGGHGERRADPVSGRGKDGAKDVVSSRETGSVLQRYIERFRHGVPMSREQRHQADGGQQRDFWWLESSPPAPNSTSTPKDKDMRSVPFTCQGQNTLTVENLQKRDNLDIATDHLQEKAERLLNSAQSIGSSGPIVSTAGLGSTGSDTTGSSFSEPAVRPMFLPREGGLRPGAARKGYAGQSHPVDHSKDILYKWRLQRKLEGAREGRHIPTSSAQGGTRATAAEKEIHSRLAAFKEKLSQRGSLTSKELTEAKVEKTMTQIQAVMDAGVQTSPVKIPSSSHSVIPPPSWSYGRRSNSEADTSNKPVSPTSFKKVIQTVSTATQLSDDFLSQSVDTQQSHSAMTQTADMPSAHHSKSHPAPSDKHTLDSAMISQNDRPNGKSITEPETASETALSNRASSSGASEKLREVANVPESSQEAVTGVQYRQYLKAEKPHVHDGGDTPVKRASSGRREKRHSAASAPTGPSSQDRKMRLAPGDGGDASFAGDKPSLDTSSQRKDDTSGMSRDMDLTCEPDQPREASQQRRAGSTQQRSGGERSGSMPPPQYSSSPARTPLTSAIGQVVKDRMFDLSVMSSVDSLSSLPYAAASPLPPTHSESLLETGYESDGEFEGDPLLQVLRVQRQQHETQLRLLDSLLTERGVR